MPQGGFGIVATTLRANIYEVRSNGKVLVVGGDAADGIGIASAELYDPATGVWSAAGTLANGRLSHTATLLNNGTVLVTGGEDRELFVPPYNPTDLPSAEIYNPATNSWSTTGSMAVGRRIHQATLLANGDVLIASGVAGANGQTNTETREAARPVEVYHPSSSAMGTWSTHGTIATGRYGRYHGAPARRQRAARRWKRRQ